MFPATQKQSRSPSACSDMPPDILVYLSVLAKQEGTDLRECHAYSCAWLFYVHIVGSQESMCPYTYT